MDYQKEAGRGEGSWPGNWMRSEGRIRAGTAVATEGVGPFWTERNQGGLLKSEHEATYMTTPAHKGR